MAFFDSFSGIPNLVDGASMADIVQQRRNELASQVMSRLATSDEFLEMVNRNIGPYQRLMTYYECAMMEVETKFRVLDAEYSLQHDRNPIESIKTRLKSTDSLAKKLVRKGFPLTVESIEQNIYDVAGVRVVCTFPEDMFALADALLAQDDVVLIERRDYVNNPKPSGYRSLHLVVKVPVFLSRSTELVPVEIQIRTIAMDFWASLEHQLRYKSGEDVSAGIPERLARCAETSAMLDLEMQDIYHAINGFGGLEPAALSPQLMKMANEFYESSKKSSEEE